MNKNWWQSHRQAGVSRSEVSKAEALVKSLTRSPTRSLAVPRRIGLNLSEVEIPRVSEKNVIFVHFLKNVGLRNWVILVDSQPFYDMTAQFGILGIDWECSVKSPYHREVGHRSKSSLQATVVPRKSIGV